MSTKLVIGFAVALVLGVLGFSFLGAVIGATNGFVRQEEGVTAQYSDNQSNYDKMFKSFRETAQVTDMYAGDLEKVYKGAISARYGEDGSKALFQFIKEQNPNFDASLYTRLQAMIEANRNSFAAAQTTLLDKCRVYKTDLRTFPNSLAAGFFNYPKIKLDDTCTVVTSERTDRAFATKKDEEIKLR